MHRSTAQAARHSSGVDRPTALLTAGTAALAWALAAWLVAICLLDLATVIPGVLGRGARSLRARITPAVLARSLRFGVVGATGAGVLGTVAPAIASGTAGLASNYGFASEQCGSDAAQAAVPDLDRPVSACATVAAAVDPRVTHTVVSGDSLWAIAAADLGHRSRRPVPAAAIAARWPQWWQANRAVLGDDPALLHPGDVLVRPTSTSATTTE